MRVLLAACAIVALGAAPRSAPIATSATGAIVVANSDSASVTIVDGSAREEIAVGAIPQTVFVRGNDAFVACTNRIVAVDLATRKVRAARFVGAELFGVVADGDRLFVSDSGASLVRVLDASTLAQTATIATAEYPRGLAIDGQRLYVTHFRSGKLSVIDTGALSVINTIATSLDSNLSQAVTLANGRAYLPQTRSNASNNALLFDTTVFPIVSVIDLAAGANLQRERFSIDIIDRPSNMPIDSVITTPGKLYVANAGSDDVSVIDIAKRTLVGHVSVGRNPRGLALSPDERFVYVTNALSGSVSAIDTATDAVTSTIDVTTIPLPPNVLNGKILFHTSARAALAKDRWISCATCHFDGGTDGRTWFFRDGPRNTTALFGVGSTLPMHWSGDLDELQDVESTVRIIQAGSGLAAGDMFCTPACDLAPPNARRSQDLDDLAAFMGFLQAPPRTVTPNARGESVFAGAGCASCHTPPLYTDRKKHDVGTGAGAAERKGSTFDTPSLRGLFDTAPYFHDGSAATLRDVIVTRNHGNAATLSESDVEALVEFLRSIPFPQPKRRIAR